MNTPASPDPDDQVARLLKLAGERDAPNQERMAMARAAAHASWRKMLNDADATKPRRRFAGLIALAAAAAVAAIVMFPGLDRRINPPVAVAHVVAFDGHATLQASDTRLVIGATGVDIHSGAELVTGDGRLALALGESLSLRLDQYTRLRFDDAQRVTLLEGAIYVDSGGLNAAPFLRIATAIGEVRHVGTQFQVTVDDGATSVQVREGRVIVSPAATPATQIDVGTGEELRIDASRSVLTRGMASHGPQWEWMTTIAPPFDIENRPLAEFLAWIVREHGWQLRYDDENLQQATRDIRLHGSISSMTSAAMLETVSMITGVSLRARDGVLLVSRS